MKGHLPKVVYYEPMKIRLPKRDNQFSTIQTESQSPIIPPGRDNDSDSAAKAALDGCWRSLTRNLGAGFDIMSLISISRSCQEGE